MGRVYFNGYKSLPGQIAHGFTDFGLATDFQASLGTRSDFSKHFLGADNGEISAVHIKSLT